MLVPAAPAAVGASALRSTRAVATAVATPVAAAAARRIRGARVATRVAAPETSSATAGSPSSTMHQPVGKQSVNRPQRVSLPLLSRI
jgi:hypothetical protein